MLSNEELKKKILDMLEQDKEFRHAVAGAIGYKEILDRIARVEEELRNLREETNKLREETNRLRQDMQEGFRRHDEELKRHWESIEKLRQDMIEGFRRHDEEFKRVWESIENLRRDMQEGFRRHDEEFKRIDKRLRSIESYMEKTSLTLEEEARDVIQYMLREKGLTLSISRLELPDIEIDIYGVDTEYCIVGEVKTRASSSLVESVDKDIELLCSRYPQYIRKKLIKVIYAMQITQDALNEGNKRNIWLVTAKGELTSLKIVDR
ncbi:MULTISPECIES: hypothetical protein [Candidatus Nitrosocaldus]|uniref:DUF8196 domain-containing protein n=1 Tax=Candidatus Nitrosocaldus cavascurensis TaxID=2058097 RepID=A0A2K5AP20_9ARCH|nr:MULTISPECIES: hypothetical protein [Candidatus Nitrosocaldus]SPC33386.1 conserved protein of unknown function [Candidatus Nitrosocaldus cavascurensis]